MARLYSREMVHALNQCVQSTGFVIVTSHERKTHSNASFIDYQFHVRDGQPCFGGEQRKYESVDGDNCSRPESHKPTDLYATFPEGTPYAMGYPFVTTHYEANDDTDAFLKALYSDESPWFNGFGGSQYVEFTPTKNGNHLMGVVLSSTDVDPTVMVNSGQFAKTVISNGGHGFKELLELGLTVPEVLGTMMLNNGSSPVTNGYIQMTGSYYFPVNFSARRFFEQRPHDLSGGLFSQGFDYNRKKIQDIFSAKDGEGMVWQESLTSKGLSTYGNDVSTKEAKMKIVTAIKEFFDEGRQKDVTLTDRPVDIPEAFLKLKGLWKEPEQKVA